MPSNYHKAKQIQANQQLEILHDRLAFYLQKQNINELHRKTGISKAALYRYISTHDVPTLPKLALIAQECRVSLAWLFGGDEKDDAHIEKAASSKPQTLTVIDDAMHPTIKQHADIQYQLLKPLPKKKRWPDGLYVLTNPQGLIVRRVQWRESDNAYRVYGDNQHYAPQTVATIAPVGNVTAVIHPI